MTATVTGWRVSFLGRAGLQRSRRDRYGSPLLWAACNVFPHSAPAPDCTCGLALVPHLPDLIDAIENRPWSVELHPLRALGRGMNPWEAMTTSHRPELLAYGTSYGDVQPSASKHDPHGTVRCEAIMLSEIYLLPWSRHRTDDLQQQTGIEPVVVEDLRMLL